MDHRLLDGRQVHILHDVLFQIVSRLGGSHDRLSFGAALVACDLLALENGTVVDHRLVEAFVTVCIGVFRIERGVVALPAVFGQRHIVTVDRLEGIDQLLRRTGSRIAAVETDREVLLLEIARRSHPPFQDQLLRVVVVDRLLVDQLITVQVHHLLGGFGCGDPLVAIVL